MAHLVDAGASSSAGAAQLFAAAALAQDQGETTDYSAISRYSTYFIVNITG